MFFSLLLLEHQAHGILQHFAQNWVFDAQCNVDICSDLIFMVMPYLWRVSDSLVSSLTYKAVTCKNEIVMRLTFHIPFPIQLLIQCPEEACNDIKTFCLYIIKIRISYIHVSWFFSCQFGSVIRTQSQCKIISPPPPPPPPPQKKKKTWPKIPS